MNRKQHSRARQLERAITRYVHRGWPTKSLEILERKETRILFGDAQEARARATIAHGYFVSRVDDKALAQAEKAVAQSPDWAGHAHWTAGLAAWRLGRFDKAAQHFDALTRARGISDWNVAAGGFWAARAYLVSRQPSKVSPMLRIAAKYPRSFYGILARRALGFATAFDWAMPEMTSRHRAALESAAAARRGLALLQLGNHDLAEEEFLRVDGGDDPIVAEMLLNVADAADLPGLSLKVGRHLEHRTGRRYDAAIYPLPHWEPPEGYIVDRALVFAFMRQESQFKPDATSRAGARGLMQLMPGTASFVAGDRSLRRGRGKRRLYDPEYNISLGQQYLAHLLGLGAVNNDLFRLMTAYNGGPGNLQKWDAETPHNNDGLLFIESIPSRETRIFIERVMTNLWIYRQRLGQPAPSLDRLAAGQWPGYSPLGNGTKVASNVKNQR